MTHGRRGTAVIDPGIVNLVCHDGVHPTYVDLALCRAPTRRAPWRLDHILEELRTSYAAARAREEDAIMHRRLTEHWSEL